jgi:hypothetical protein
MTQPSLPRTLRCPPTALPPHLLQGQGRRPLLPAVQRAQPPPPRPLQAIQLIPYQSHITLLSLENRQLD